LARKPELALSDLNGHGWWLSPLARHPALRRVLHACRAAGFDPVAVHHSRNPEFAMGLVLAEHGVASILSTVARWDPRVCGDR